MENDELKKFFCEDIAALCRTGVLPVIVHGGGPQIAKMLTELKIESSFVQGLRVTNEATMAVAKMVLCGTINKEITGLISMQPGVRGAVGLCGLDGKLIQAKPIVKKTKDENGKEVVLDLGLVGDPTIVNTQMIKDLLSISLVPVVAPVGFHEGKGGSLNINADTAAGAVAEAIKVRQNGRPHFMSSKCTLYSISLSLSLSHTHTNTHTLSLSLTHTHTLYLSLSSHFSRVISKG